MQYICTLVSYSEGKLGIDQEHQAQRAEFFFSSGGNDTRGVNSDHEDKLRDQLAALDSAKAIADMDLPGWRLHPLKGTDKGRRAISVSGNGRMTFEFENGDAYVEDYEDYH